MINNHIVFLAQSIRTCCSCFLWHVNTNPNNAILMRRMQHHHQNQHSHIDSECARPCWGVNKATSALHCTELSQHAATLLQLSGMQPHQSPSAACCQTVKRAAASGAYEKLHCMLPTFAPSNCCCSCSCGHLTSPQARETCNNCTALRPFINNTLPIQTPH